MLKNYLQRAQETGIGLTVKEEGCEDREICIMKKGTMDMFIVIWFIDMFFRNVQGL